MEQSRLTGFLLGLAISVSIFITALEFNSGASDNGESTSPLDHLVKDLAIPAVDEQDQQANKPQTKQKNEILSPKENDEAQPTEESADDIPQEASEAAEAQAGQGEQQFTTVREAEMTEETSPEPEQKIVAAPPAPLDPVDPASADATNLVVPPGGWAEFNKWMGENLKYPKAAEKQKVKGDVVLSFIVNTDGSLSDIKVTQSANKLLADEALRVARLMGKWKPGYRNHKPCRTYVELPVKFNL